MFAQCAVIAVIHPQQPQKGLTSRLNTQTGDSCLGEVVSLNSLFTSCHSGDFFTCRVATVSADGAAGVVVSVRATMSSLTPVTQKYGFSVRL